MDTLSRVCFRIVITTTLAMTMLACGGREYSAERKKQRVILAAGETHEGWYFASGDQVVLEGTVNGDAYIAGGVVQVDGTINGDLLVAGGQVVITGNVTDDVRAAGGSVECTGRIGKNLTVAGGTVRVGKGSEVGGGLLAAGGSLFVAGSVEHDAMVASSDMSLSGTVKGNMDFAGGALTTLQGSTVGGDLKAFVDDSLRVEIASGTVHGASDVSTRQTKAARTILGLGRWQFWLKMFWALSLIVSALVLMLLFPRQVIGIGKAILEHPAQSLLWGIVGLVVVPLVVIVLLITVVGIPLGLLLLGLYFWILYLSQLSLGVALGQRLFGGEGTWRLVGAFAVGILIVQVLTLVPVLGIILTLAGLLFGLGAVLAVLKNEYSGWQKREYVSPAARV